MFTLSGPRIISICKTLKKHHSVDVRSLNAQLQEVYKNSAMDPQPWKCLACNKLHKAEVEFCPKYGKHWTKAADPKFVPGEKKQHTPRERQRPWWEETAAPSTASPSTTWNDGNAKPRKPSRKEKKEKNRQKNLAQDTPFSAAGAWPTETPFPVSPSPFTTYAPGAHVHPPQPPWQQVEKAAEAQAEESQEWIAAVKAAFPEIEKMPQALRQKIDQSEMNVLRQSKSELHKATNGLYRAKSTMAQLLDARKKHQLAWCSHLQTAIQQWKQQSVLYQQQQDDYMKRIAQAQEEIKLAQHTIGLLNMKASGTGPSPAEPETQIDIKGADKELQSRSQELFSTLQNAIENVMPTPIEPQIIQSDEESSKPTPAPPSTKRRINAEPNEEGGERKDSAMSPS